MGLRKNKIYTNGVSGEYWVAMTRCDAHNSICHVSVIPYVSQTKRNEGCTPLTGEMSCGTIAGKYPTGAEVYAHIKSYLTGRSEEGEEERWFSDAEDV